MGNKISADEFVAWTATVFAPEAAAGAPFELAMQVS